MFLLVNLVSINYIDVIVTHSDIHFEFQTNSKLVKVVPVPSPIRTTLMLFYLWRSQHVRLTKNALEYMLKIAIQVIRIVYVVEDFLKSVRSHLAFFTRRSMMVSLNHNYASKFIRLLWECYNGTFLHHYQEETTLASTSFTIQLVKTTNGHWGLALLLMNTIVPVHIQRNVALSRKPPF